MSCRGDGNTDPGSHLLENMKKMSTLSWFACLSKNILC